MRLCASFNIECAHSIEGALGVPRLHGHSYIVRVCVASRQDMPTPLPSLQASITELKAGLDHQNLNDVLPWQPTMEAILWHVRRKWTGPSLVAVSVTRPTLGVSAEWEC